MKSILVIFLSLIFIIESYTKNYIQAGCDSCATLTGKVIDADTKEPLIGARVEFLSTDISVGTDIDGNYQIKSIEPGVYNIEFKYIGYSTRVVENVLFELNEKKTLDFELPDYGEEWALQADEDIQNGDIKILLGGLLVFCVPFDEVNKLCEEYGFRYEAMGCMFAYGEKYNEKVYKYLDELNGEGWKEKFDKDMDELCKEHSQKD